jgi:hypothetical protein
MVARMKILTLLTLTSLSVLGSFACSSSPGSGCPSSAPKNGDPCPQIEGVQIVCEYGGDMFGGCTTLAVCAPSRGGSWSWAVQAPQDCAAPPSSCPASYAAVSLGQTCPIGDAVCDYPEGRCGCSPCGTPPNPTGAIWNCSPWAPAPCRPPRPLAGSPCATEGERCNLGDCCSTPSLGPDLICQAGYWNIGVDPACSCVAPPACP